MNRIFQALTAVMMLLTFTACQDKDIEREAVKLTAIDANAISGKLEGDNYVWTWPAQGDLKMQVTLYANGTKSGSEIIEGATYTHKNVNTNEPYSYVFKLTDGTNYSQGVVKEYLREGATQISGLSMSQVEAPGGYNAYIEWNKAVDADQISIVATNGKQTVDQTLAGTAVNYVINDVKVGDVWNVTLRGINAKGTSTAATVSLKIGKTAIGFLSAYETEGDLLDNGDDDEASAWLWLKSEYPTARYVYFGDIKSSDDLDAYRVLFWLRDIETGRESDVWEMPKVAMDALESVKSWYKNGGSLLLWSHAIPYIANLGRVDGEILKNNDRTIGCGAGGINPDTWAMAVQLHPGSKFKKDHSSHPIYKGLDVAENDRTKLISFKGPGWTEDHNCLFFNYPSIITGIGNQEEACYAQITEKYGIYPLGTWDSQIDWVSQLNVWEARQGDTEYQGTVLCIGNGGCEFSMKNEDGTPDKSAYPKNNIYQDNVLKLAKNCLEYLKTR